MRVLYLFGGIRGGLVEKMKRGEDPGGGTWGMLPLRTLGVTADFVELEQWFSPKVARFLRQKVLGAYGSHLPFFFKFFSYDIVFTAGAFTSQLVFTFLRSAFRLKRPLWVMHDFSITGLLRDSKTFKQKIFRYLVSHADGIVTVGKWETEELKRRFPHLAGRIEYIPFGVDTEFFAPQDVSQEQLILAVGIDPDRDWKTFFKACEGLDARVVVAGSSRRTSWFDPPKNVEVRFFEPKEMVEMYAKAAVVVIPLDTSTGVNDAMGCSTLFEAMAVGKAMVVSRTHTMESYVTDGENGFLVEQKSVAEMRDAIRTLLNDQALRERIGHAARTYALEHLELMHCAKKLASFFERRLGESAR